jgi:hypothetical protein
MQIVWQQLLLVYPVVLGNNTVGLPVLGGTVLFANTVGCRYLGGVGGTISSILGYLGYHPIRWRDSDNIVENDDGIENTSENM